MPEYALTLHFGAPDEETARKRAGDIADVCAVEHGTRDPFVAPVDAAHASPGPTPPTGDLRDRYAEAMRAHYINTEERDADGHNPCVCGNWWDDTMSEDWDAHLADAVLAVRDAELERLRGELADANTSWERVLRRATTAEQALVDSERRRAEQGIAAGEAIERAEQAEDRLRVTADAYTRLQAQADAAEAARARWQERGKQAEAAIERVRELYGRWEQGVANLYAANEEEGHAVAAIARAARAEEIERCARELRDVLSAPDSPASGRTGEPRVEETHDE